MRAGIEKVPVIVWKKQNNTASFPTALYATLGLQPLLGALGACPLPIPGGGPSESFVTPYRPKYHRYQDRKLHEAYTHVVSALREKQVPVYGHIFTEDEADKMARNVIDALRKLPQSAELQERARCALEPMVAGAARAEVAKLLLGTLAFGTLSVAALTAWRHVRRR
jgi:hypothetical protein